MERRFSKLKESTWGREGGGGAARRWTKPTPSEHSRAWLSRLQLRLKALKFIKGVTFVT